MVRNGKPWSSSRPRACCATGATCRCPVHQRCIPDCAGRQDEAIVKSRQVKRVIACSGKVYYDLVKKRRKGASVAIIVEQLYPFPHKAFAAELKKFSKAADIVWCQDEPQNQGAWFFIQHNIHENMIEGQKLGYAGRAASASPAVGYAHLHQEQQKALVDAAFAKLKGFVLTK